MTSRVSRFWAFVLPLGSCANWQVSELLVKSVGLVFRKQEIGPDLLVALTAVAVNPVFTLSCVALQEEAFMLAL